MCRLNCVFLLALLMMLLALMTSRVTCQIHFSPTWGTGKRSGAGGMPGPSSSSASQSASDACWADSDLRLVYTLAQIVKQEAMRFNQCMQGYQMEAFKDE